MPGARAFPLKCFVGLTVAGGEITVVGYARQSVTLAYCADGVTIANTAAVSWPHATARWGVIDGAPLFDAVTSGTELGSPVATGRQLAVEQYDTVNISPSGIVVADVLAPRGYGAGGFGTFGYGTYRILTGTVALNRGFDQQHVCASGAWAPGPFSRAA
jgi:hypothetical protein